MDLGYLVMGLFYKLDFWVLRLSEIRTLIRGYLCNLCQKATKHVKINPNSTPKIPCLHFDSPSTALRLPARGRRALRVTAQ